MIPLLDYFLLWHKFHVPLIRVEDSAERAKEIWEVMSIEKDVGKKNIDITELEESIVITIDEEA